MQLLPKSASLYAPFAKCNLAPVPLLSLKYNFYQLIFIIPISLVQNYIDIEKTRNGFLRKNLCFYRIFFYIHPFFPQVFLQTVFPYAILIVFSSRIAI